MVLFVFVFFKQNTAYELRISDWSSEVCSSDLAKMVADCGASYLIWAVNHGHPTCPAPIKSWEKLHPGWTTKRDFIGELADALGKHGIRLMLYMNCPGIGKLEQQRSEEHTSELQSLMRISYAVFCLKQKIHK